MRREFWRSMLIICLLQGLATAVSPYAGMIVGVFIAGYLVSRMWFVDHPATWRYDLLFFIVLVGIALTAAGVFAGICAVLPVRVSTTRACLTLSFKRALWLHICMSGLIGGILWISIRLWTWWKLR